MKGLKELVDRAVVLYMNIKIYPLSDRKLFDSYAFVGKDALNAVNGLLRNKRDGFVATMRRWQAVENEVIMRGYTPVDLPYFTRSVDDIVAVASQKMDPRTNPIAFAPARRKWIQYLGFPA